MKRILAMLLAAMVLASMSACGQNADSQGDITATSAPVQEGNQSPAEAESPAETEAPAPTKPPEPEAEIEETVLVDESDVKITVTGIKYTAYDVKLELTLENNSSQNLSFYSGTIGYACNSVNGYMMTGGYLGADVAAGKKSNETVSFKLDELRLMGITDIADIELGFSLKDDDYDVYLQTDARKITTSITDKYDYSADTYRETITNSGMVSSMGLTVLCDSDEEVFDQKGVRVVSQTLIKNTSDEPVLLLEVENTSEEALKVSLSDFSVNGLGVQSGTWDSEIVSPGKRRVFAERLPSMLDEPFWEVFGIEEIGSVSYSLQVIDLEGDKLTLPEKLSLSISGANYTYDDSGEELYSDDGIRIVLKSVEPDSRSYVDDVHILMLVENGRSERINPDVEYGSLSVNGYMTSFICFGRWADPGCTVVVDVDIQDYSLEENKITGVDSITDIELTFEIRNESYKTIASPSAAINIK